MDFFNWFKLEICERDFCVFVKIWSMLIVVYVDLVNVIEGDCEQEVYILVVQIKSKKFNCYVVVEQVQISVFRLVKGFLEGLIVVIEMLDMVMDMIKLINIVDVESWWKVEQNVGMVEKKYV